jgi:hypothetical protein
VKTIDYTTTKEPIELEVLGRRLVFERPVVISRFSPWSCLVGSYHFDLRIMHDDTWNLTLIRVGGGRGGTPLEAASDFEHRHQELAELLLPLTRLVQSIGPDALAPDEAEGT